MKKNIGLLLLLMCGTSFAAPTVTDVVAKQRYPWNGLVDITCNVSGIDESITNRLFFISILFPDSSRIKSVWNFGVMRNGTNSTERIAEDNGNYHLLWDAEADLGQVRCTNMIVRVVVDERRKIQLWEGGPYWAETNIGAETPWDYGYYFWWGDTVGYKMENNVWVSNDGSISNFSFSTDNTLTSNKETSLLQNEGWISADSVLVPEHDAAKVHWGEGWRMPSEQELSDLNSKCTWIWATTNGVNGYIVRGRGDFASVSIFLPATGVVDGAWHRNAGLDGYYWTSVPFSFIWYYNDAWCFLFNSENRRTAERARSLGQTIRPVHGGAEL